MPYCNATVWCVFVEEHVVERSLPPQAEAVDALGKWMQP